MEKTTNLDQFNVILLGIIFNPANKKILIGRRSDSLTEGLNWSFPGDLSNHKEDVDKTLKKKIKEQTGLEIKNLGSIFAGALSDKKDHLVVYFLCEAVGGEEKAADDLVELKWVSPEEVEKHFTTSFHPRLKEYIMNLK